MADVELMKNQIRSKIFALADEFAEIPERINDEDNILELGVLDSVGVLQLISWYEEHFQIQLAKDEMNVKNLGTLTAMAQFAITKMGQA